MKKLLPIIVVLVAGMIGAGGGFFLKQSTSAKPEKATADTTHDEDEGKSKKTKKTKESHGKAGGADAIFMRFSRQFVVPVVKGGKPQVMMILDVSIEIDASLQESIYSLEPRLRDAMLAELLRQSSAGALIGIIGDDDAMDDVKSALLARARAITGDGVKDILILDIGIQEY